ncbi:uncharacterized protein LOC116853278 [Odontomachus brunneus]|uniref:uncharacterized protein LOC116853278 n=1 Tax=Odontomachus brunneus TaxID=486640 RepID=UPI0013F19C37|nr:uncharacterized protein LOC116853278 [Odontomachus brunneus]XP_032690166.1 uncharacterized protein LOC116853278 [Odontomachus brunneus]
MMNAQRLFYYVVLLLLKVTYFHVSAKQNYFISKQWILENMPFLPIIFAKSEYLPDGRCKEDTQRLLYDLLNGSTWATQMFDSSTKYPEGIFYGHTRHLGNFDECYNLQVTTVQENTNTREINGKYCFVNIEYKREHAVCQKLLFNATPISVSNYQNETSNSFWNVIEVYHFHSTARH